MFFDYFYEGLTFTSSKQICADAETVIQTMISEVIEVNNFSGDYEEDYDFEGKPLEELILTICKISQKDDEDEDDDECAYSCVIYSAGIECKEIINKIESDNFKIIECLCLICDF